jgi:hypothetical protein
MVTSLKNCVPLSASSGSYRIRDCTQQFLKDTLRDIVILLIVGVEDPLIKISID